MTLGHICNLQAPLLVTHGLTNVGLCNVSAGAQWYTGALVFTGVTIIDSSVQECHALKNYLVEWIIHLVVIVATSQ